MSTMISSRKLHVRCRQTIMYMAWWRRSEDVVKGTYGEVSLIGGTGVSRYVQHSTVVSSAIPRKPNHRPSKGNPISNMRYPKTDRNATLRITTNCYERSPGLVRHCSAITALGQRLLSHTILF